MASDFNAKQNTNMKKIKRTTPPLSKEEMKARALPAEERIRQRAYEIHKARGGGPGGELDDWLQAERELQAELERPRSSEAGKTGG